MSATIMQVELSHAVEVLQELGHKNADQFPAAKVKSKLEEVVGKLSDEDKAAVEHDAFDRIADAIENGKDWEILAPSTADDSAAPAKPKKGKGGKASSNGKAPKASGKDKPTKPKKDAVKRDKFGSRLDSNVAKINAVIGRKAKSAKEIAEAAGNDKLTSVTSHLQTLAKKGLVRKTEDHKYVLKV